MRVRVVCRVAIAIPLSWIAVACAPSARSAPEAANAPDAMWIARAQQQIAAREYRASHTAEQGPQAPNRAHNLRTYFDQTGIRVHDRTAAGSPQLRLSLRGVGRAGSLAAVPHAEEVVVDENRVELRRPGLVEWYVNSPAGLEQGFTLAQRPAGDGPLVVELAVADAQPALRFGAISFETASGRRLSFAKLAASDASGGALAAHFELPDAQRLRIVVDDAQASYPLVIDPILTETDDAQLESNQGSGFLGFSVAAAGDVNGDGFADVIVGAPGYDAGQSDEGAAFVFHGNASGIADGNPSTAATQLESNQASANLGWSVAGAGDVNGDGFADVIVGAWLYDAAQSDEGAAFVFHGSASGVPDGNPATAIAQLESNQISAQLGWTVSGAGDLNGDGFADVIVGAPRFDAGQAEEGAAFIFHGSAAGIPDGSPLNAVTQLESNQINGFCGWQVAGAGDVNSDGFADVIVGAYLYDAGQVDEGAAFIFHGSATGVADGNPVTAVTQLEANQINAQLGWSVSGAGDVNGDGYADVIVGSLLYDAGQTDEGAAFVFHGSATGVADGNPATAVAQLESNQMDAQLGITVGGAGDVDGDGYADVIVGAYLYDAGETNEGAAFVFPGGAAGVADGNPATAEAQLESNQASAQGGYSVAGAGDVNGDGYADVIAGARLFNALEGDEGVAFVYLGGAQGVVDGDPLTAAAQLESDQANAELGWSVAGAGDVNADGYADVIVGAPRYDAGQTDEGAAFVFLGSAVGVAAGDPATASAQLESNQVGAFFGWSVARAGDVNGDGYSDVIVGAYLYNGGNLGGAFVFHGGAGGISDGNPATAATRLECTVSSQFAWSVAGAGDVNGDSFGDVIVGARSFSGGQGTEGGAFVFLGTGAGIASGDQTTASARLESNQAGAQLGESVAGAGDVNGDGFADVIVGAHRYDAGQTDEGAAFVFHGSATGVANGNPSTAAAQLELDQATATPITISVAGAGDVNRDGFADVIVGASHYDAGETDEGAAFVFHGSATGVADGNPTTAAAQLEGDLAAGTFGHAVAGAGDVNGDGYADVIIGARFYTAPTNLEGAAFVFPGSASGIADGNPATAAAQLESNQMSAFLGQSVAGAGDVNGDGYADVIVGAYRYDGGQAAEGAAFTFLGAGGGGGRPVLARQRRGDGSGTPVQPWGGSTALDAFAFELVANHPAGSGRVRAEIEACPPGLPFGHASCSRATSPTWLLVNSATPQLALAHTFSGLTANQLYRWRARVLHAPATGPLPANAAHGPWRRVDAQAVEGDIRIPEPSAWLSLTCGAALLGALGRRRNRGSSTA